MRRYDTQPSLVLLFLALAGICAAQAQEGSRSALRFFGTGVDQQDRVRIRIDDDVPAADASAPADVGRGSFSLDFWLRGRLEDNATSSGGGDRWRNDYRWIDGNIVVDRDIWGGSERSYGVSLAGGLVRFGVGGGDADGDGADTIEGDVNVLDGRWHHIAVVRNVDTGVLTIFVDGVEDFSSGAGASRADLSYPDEGVPTQRTEWGPWIFLGCEKHDAGPSYPSFNGFLDEFRVWNVALDAAVLEDIAGRVVESGRDGLVAYYRFEEGSGTEVADSSLAGSPVGELIAGVPGNGEWVSAEDDPENVAPIAPLGPPVGSAPQATISMPLAGSEYRAGEVILFAGGASDAEDGELAAGRLLWRLIEVEEDEIIRVIASASGVSSGEFAIPARGARREFGSYAIELVARDSDGRSDRVRALLRPRTSVLRLATIPAGVPLRLDGVEISTPAVYASLAGWEHEIEAPRRLVVDGEPAVFRCWSDGGERVHGFVAPDGGLSLDAFLAPSPGETDVDVPVPANDRNADYNPAFGLDLSNNYDLFGLCVGRDSNGPYETALAFLPGLPQGARMVTASITVQATNDQSGFVDATLRAHDSSDVEPFTPGAGPALTALYPLTSARVEWSMPLFRGGELYESPDLAPLLQELVDREDWSADSVVSIVLDAGETPGGSWRCLRNAASGDAARLTVVYALEDPPDPPACPWSGGGGEWRRCDFNCDGASDVSDAVANLDFLFTDGEAPCCLAQTDCNTDGVGDLSDAVFLLLHLFAGGRAPDEPFSACGDPGGCPGYVACRSSKNGASSAASES